MEILRLFLPYLGALLAAGAVALAIYTLITTIRIETAAAKHLRDFRDEGVQNSRQAEIGDRVAKSIPISWETWEGHITWAQRGGYYKGQGIGNIVFMAMLYMVGSIALVVIWPIPVLFVVPLIAFLFPFIGLRAKANKVRRKAVSSLPEVAVLVAAEIAASTPADQAILRAAELPGPLGSLLDETLAFSRQTGRPIFSRKPVQGALVEIFARTRLPALRAFAMQLDEVAAKGVDAAELMNDTAKSLAREYHERVMMEKEQLGSILTRHVAFHFFMPAVIVILLAFFIPILSLLSP